MNRCRLHADKAAEPHVRGCPDCDRDMDNDLNKPGNPDSYPFPSWYRAYMACLPTAPRVFDETEVPF